MKFGGKGESLRLLVIPGGGPTLCNSSRRAHLLLSRIGTASSSSSSFFSSRGMATNTAATAARRANERRQQAHDEKENQVERLCKEGQLAAALAGFKNRPDTSGALALMNACQLKQKHRNGTAQVGKEEEEEKQSEDLLDMAFEVYKHWASSEEVSVLRAQLGAHGNAARGHTTDMATTTTTATAAAGTASGVKRAQRVFSGLMNVCLLCKQPHRALPLLDEMEQWSLTLDRSSFCHLLRACGSTGDAVTAKKLLAKVKAEAQFNKVNVIDCTQLVLAFERNRHGTIQIEEVRSVLDVMRQQGVQPDALLGNKLITIIGRLKHVDDARQVFDRMSQRDLISWTAMIAVYVQNGEGREALKLFERMQQEGMKPDNVTFVNALGACANIAALAQGKQIHSQIINGGVKPGTILETALMNMYSKCGSLTDARQVFDKMSQRDVVSWNAMIAGYAQHGEGREALKLFERMQQEGMKPNNVTFVNALNACANAVALTQGKQIYAHIISTGVKPDISINNALVNMYSKCGSLIDARQIFDTMSQRDLASWNTIIVGYAQHGEDKEAFGLFERMQQEGMKPDNGTFISILSACTSAAMLVQGKQIHAQIINDKVQPDMILETALVNMYSKCGSLTDARQVFDKMSQRDVVSWDALIAGYVQNGEGREALKLFERMQQEGMKPDNVTFINALSACANAAALAQGKQIHSQIINSGVKCNTILETALVNMYSKCGSLTDARQVFDKMSQQDLLSWNTIIAGYAQHGEGREALKLFERMQQEGMKPNNVTFISLLSACSHSGLVEEGVRCFELMQVEHKITPTVDHYSCLVDLFARAGRLDDAEKIITTAPVSANVVIWMTMLGACRLHGDVDRAERMAARIVELEPQNAAVYVLLGNIYAGAGRWADEARVRGRMRELGIRKEPGQSWIEIDGQVHTFLADDRSHPERRQRIDEAMGEVSTRIAAIGYKPDTSWVLHNVNERDKESLLCQHSEKLAAVYGLISTPPGTPLVIVKNLRMCGDCHNAAKHIAKAYGREIKVRDANRYHHFSKDGTCSCHDYF